MARRGGFLRLLVQAAEIEAKRQQAAQRFATAQEAARLQQEHRLARQGEIDAAHHAKLREREEAAQVRAEAQNARLLARQKSEEQSHARAIHTSKQEAWRASMSAQADERNDQLEQAVTELGAILKDSLTGDSFVDLNALRSLPDIPPFDASRFQMESVSKAAHIPEPDPVTKPVPVWEGRSEPAPYISTYLPAALTPAQRLWPATRKRYAEDVKVAQEAYERDVASHEQRETQRKADHRRRIEDTDAAYLREVAEARARYEQQVADEQQAYVRRLALAKERHEQEIATARELHARGAAEIRAEAEKQNAEIEALQQGLADEVPESVATYFSFVLEANSYPDGFPQQAKIAYVPESKQLVVEYDLPPFSIIPEARAYKYVASHNEITTAPRPVSQRRSLYASVTAQIALRTMHELFTADRDRHLAVIVFNGYVDATDEGTGRPIRPCLVTVRTTRETFSSLDLSKVDPIACLRTLSASVSKSPAELAPVRPILEFSMVDPRFVASTDVLSQLDSRPNLMDLTPSEFEALITNLFEKMGLETRLTQASRDGGVDCVAYDQRPILGGKVVIQAKRYKHTVGVSAVRDLYGTVQNEGASKGILVTTSGYGKAAFDFIKGKPLELLSGSNLLALLADHAGIEAKIEMPAHWKDPDLDVGEVDSDPIA